MNTTQHPGAILREHILNPLHWNSHQAAALLHISPHELEAVIDEQQPMNRTVASALETTGFGTAAAWIAIQEMYDAQHNNCQAA